MWRLFLQMSILLLNIEQIHMSLNLPDIVFGNTRGTRIWRVGFLQLQNNFRFRQMILLEFSLISYSKRPKMIMEYFISSNSIYKRKLLYIHDNAGILTRFLIPLYCFSSPKHRQPHHAVIRQTRHIFHWAQMTKSIFRLVSVEK